MLNAQEVSGYDDPETLLECWSQLCYYKMLGFQPQESDPDMLLHYLLYCFWDDEETVLQACVTSEDIIDLGHFGFFRTIQGKQLAWEYFCELFSNPTGVITNDAVEFFGLDMQYAEECSSDDDAGAAMINMMDDDNDEFHMEVGADYSVSDSDSCNISDAENDKCTTEEDSDGDISVEQWMKEHGVVMMYGAGP